MCPAPPSKANRSGKSNMCSVHKELTLHTDSILQFLPDTFIHSKEKRSCTFFPFSLWKKISLCCLLHFQDFLENLAACHNVFLESYFSIFSEMFPFYGLCTRCAIFCTFFSCCCFAAQVNRAKDVVQWLFVLISHNINRVIGCFNVLALHLNCPSRWSLYLSMQCIVGSLCWSSS